MVRKTRHQRKHKKHAYRNKTQKGGFTPQLIAEISAQISSRLGTILSNLLSRSEASGSATLATRSIAETGSAAAESLVSALRTAVQQAVSRSPALAREAPAITNEILTSATARLAQSASATATSRSAAAAAVAMTGIASTALATSASAVATALGSSLASASRNPETARAILSVLRSRVLPSIQSMLRSGRANAAREAATLLQPAALRTGLTSFGRAAAARPSAFTSQILGLQPAPYGMRGVVPRGARGISTQAERTTAQRLEAEAAQRLEAEAAQRLEAEAAQRLETNAQRRAAEAAGANVSAAAEEALAEVTGSAKGMVPRTIFTKEQVNELSRTQLIRIWEEGNPGKTLTKGYKTDQLKKNALKIMDDLSKKQQAKFGISGPPPPKSANLLLPKVPTPSDLLSQAAKEELGKRGGSATDAIKIDMSITKGKQEVGNMFDHVFTPAPQITSVITNPQAMGAALRDIPAVADNASSLVNTLFDKTALGRAIEAVQFSKSNVAFYRMFGGKQIAGAEVAAYNTAVKESIRLLLEKTPKREVENLIEVMTNERMRSFRTGFFDYFLTSPQSAMNALNTIVNQIIPHMRLTPGAMDRIITTLQQAPNDLPTVLTQIVGQRSIAQQEVSFASQLWRQRGVAQTVGRYAVLGVGASALLFLAALYGISSPYELLWHLRQDLQSIGLNDIVTSSVDTLDRFYDGLMFSVANRNVENGISNGVIAPATGILTGVSSWWSNFMRAGRPTTIFETLRDNLVSVMNNINGEYAMAFAGAAVIAALIYRARQLRIDAENAQLAAAGVNSSDTNFPNLPPTAYERMIDQRNAAAVPRANLAALPNLPANTNNW